jgi:hypothetical protein
LPRGNASVTDLQLIKTLEKYTHPVTINDLASRLNWSRGKIDGAINRLLEKKEAVIIKISSPRGQRLRYIGLPNQSYWESFYQEIIVSKNHILVNDPLGVLQSFSSQSTPPDSIQYEALKKTVNDLYRKLEEKDQQIRYLEQQALEYKTDIDPSIVKIIEDQLDLITNAAQQRNVSPAELLKTGILRITDPNFDFLTKIVSIVLDESKKKTDSPESQAARSFLRRARTLEHQ